MSGVQCVGTRLTRHRLSPSREERKGGNNRLFHFRRKKGVSTTNCGSITEGCRIITREKCLPTDELLIRFLL